jgi:hypothetical protein
MIVAELFAKLGLQVDAASFAAVNKGVQQVAAGASRAVQALKGVDRAVKQVAASAPHALDPRLAQQLSRPDAPDVLAPAASGAPAPSVPTPSAQGEPLFKRIFSAANLARTAVVGFGTAVAGSFAVQKIQAFTHEITGLSGELVRVSQRLGLSTDEVQELGYAAQIAEADIGTLETGLKFLGQNAAQAAAGSKGDAKAFKDLGISVKDAAGNVKSTPQLLEEAADAIAGLPSAAQQSAAAMQLFGRSGVQLLPLLKGGSHEIKHLREEAKRLGGGLSGDVIGQADDFEDQMFRVDFALRSVKSTIATVLLPVLHGLAQGLIDTVAWFKQTAKHTYFFQTALAGGFVSALVVAISWLRALTIAQVQAAASAALAMLPYLAAAAAVLTFALAAEDLFGMLKGNKSAIGEWIDEWLGIGTVDQLVRSWSAGIEALADALGRAATEFKDFLALGNDLFKLFAQPLDAQNWKHILESGKVVAQEVTGAAEDVAAGVHAYSLALAGGPEGVNRATARGMDAAAIAEVSTPRAVARGISAGRALGSAGFGQAARSSSILNGSPTVQQTNQLHITTGADPHEVRRVVEGELGKQNRKLKAALAPKSNGS